VCWLKWLALLKNYFMNIDVKGKSAFSYLVGSILKRQREFREAVRSGDIASFVSKYGKFDTPVKLKQ
jgi:hypothetical protein